MRILVFATDLPPLPGIPSSGTAIRTYNFAYGFEELGHEVIYSVPKDSLEKLDSQNQISDQIISLRENAFDAINQSHLIDKISPDLIFCGHWPAWTLQKKPNQKLMIDLAGPHLLERHYQGESDYEGALLGKLNAISLADYYVVSGNKQKLYFLSFLMRAGITHPEKRIVTAPMPLPDNEPFSREYSADTKFLFAGVFLPWQNPQWGLETLTEYMDENDYGALHLLGGKHPSYDIDTGSYDALFDTLSSHKRVHSSGLIPYDEFVNYMKKCDIALDVMDWNLERELAITIRTCTYLWSGLPVIYNDFADLSTLIKKYDAGWCVSPGDVSSMKSILDSIRTNPEILKLKSENAFTLAQNEFNRKKIADSVIQKVNERISGRNDEIDIQNELPELCDLPIESSSQFTQEFDCRINGLRHIEVLLATHGKSPESGMSWQLSDVSYADQDKTISEGQLEKEEIQDNQWCKITVPCQKNSAGKRYKLRLAVEKNKNISGIYPWTVRSSPYPLIQFSVGEQTIPIRSLCMKSSCTPSSL